MPDDLILCLPARAERLNHVGTLKDLIEHGQVFRADLRGFKQILQEIIHSPPSVIDVLDIDHETSARDLSPGHLQDPLVNITPIINHVEMEMIALPMIRSLSRIKATLYLANPTAQFAKTGPDERDIVAFSTSGEVLIGNVFQSQSYKAGMGPPCDKITKGLKVLAIPPLPADRAGPTTTPHQYFSRVSVMLTMNGLVFVTVLGFIGGTRGDLRRRVLWPRDLDRPARAHPRAPFKPRAFPSSGDIKDPSTERIEHPQRGHLNRNAVSSPQSGHLIFSVGTGRPQPGHFFFIPPPLRQNRPQRERPGAPKVDLGAPGPGKK
jgi:hypothetical protein